MRLITALLMLLAILPTAKPESHEFTTHFRDGQGVVRPSHATRHVHVRRILEEQDEKAKKPFVGKIIGGQPTRPGEFPFMASLRFSQGFNKGQHACGGALIAKNVVLTAGHCVDKVPNPDVHINRFTREGNDGGRRFESFKTTKYIKHPSFDLVIKGVFTFDIALFVLDGQSKQQPIEFRSDEKCFQRGSDCSFGTVLGWGRTIADSRRSKSDELLKVDVPLVPRGECNAKFPSVDITNDMVCAGEPGKDACQFDSGGPLLVSKKLSGIVSWGEGCGEEKPGVYANLADVQGWLTLQLERIKREGSASRRNCCRQFLFGSFFPPGCNRC